MTIRKSHQSLCSPPWGRATSIGAAVLMLLVSPPAFAYLDPSTGSMVVSAIVGIFASIALAVKTYWYKIKAFFKRGSGSETSHDTQQEANTRESGD
jgi:hypothetical protein